jgi:hypothetical protein
VCYLFWGHPDARIRHDDLNALALARDGDFDLAFGRRVHVRVGHEVGDDLAHAARIRVSERQIRRDVAGQLLALVRDPWRDQLKHLAHWLGHIDWPPVYLEAVGLDARDVE